MEMYFERNQIKSYHTNQFAEATIPAILNIMLEAAWAHAQSLEWGYDLLQKNNMFWVLSRLHVDFKHYPKWQETVALETWSAGTDGMYAYREYLIRNEEGEVILTANTAWLILDTSTKKVVMLRDQKETFPRHMEEGICREPKRLRHKAQTEIFNFKPVLYSELDLNQHFNSVKALERVLDEYGIDFLNEHQATSIEINYLKEGMPNDQLAVYRHEAGDLQFQSGIVRESDGAELSIYEICWKKKSN